MGCVPFVVLLVISAFLPSEQLKDPTAIQKIVLHPNGKSIFVNGIGGTEKERLDLASLLSSYVFRTPLRDPGLIELVFNPTKISFWDADKGARKKVLDYLTHKDMMSVDEGKVKLVIFCHSNGVEVVESALDPNAMISHLQGDKTPKYDKEDLKLAAQIIARNTAVIAFGGVTIIPQMYAKTVLTFITKTDHSAHAAIIMMKGRNKNFRTSENPHQEKVYIDTGKQWLGHASKAAGAMSMGSSSIGGFCGSGSGPITSVSGSSCSSPDKNPHYLENYLKVEELVQFLRKILVVKEWKAWVKSQKH